MKKSKKITLFVFLGIIGTCLMIGFAIIILLAASALPWLPMMCAACTEPDPPAPQITYAEFPFTLIYELNGEKITYTDTVICEYKGAQWSEADGKKHREWEKRFASGEEVVLSEIDEEHYIEFNTECTAAYYMGDRDNEQYYCGSVGAFLVTRYGATGKSTGRVSTEELYEDYGIKIISFEIAPPIENSFE